MLLLMFGYHFYETEQNHQVSGSQVMVELLNLCHICNEFLVEINQLNKMSNEVLG